ncbi:MAG TPA: bifunctional DNA-formamidopyrimidine glycosylase/DNA-(apurinic or apyrimidinic site) lyase [Patescibacteria group bacterium]
MPELPEVETIRRGLEKYLVGKKIESVEIKLIKQFSGDKHNIENQKITKVDRFGKGLVIEFANNYCLAIHIKLTGQLVYRGEDQPTHLDVSKTRVGALPNKWTHVIFHLNHNATLFYNDLRQFGWLKVTQKDKLKDLPFFKELGPEFFKELTLEKFTQILAKTKGPIKPLLMDQKKMSGIGNIYANDALFLAKILPTRPANSLTSQEVSALFSAIEKVLTKGLENGGSSELTYVNALGEEGNYQNHTLVYGKEKKKCPTCGGIIKKTMLAGRGTFFCSNCQK